MNPDVQKDTFDPFPDAFVIQERVATLKRHIVDDCEAPSIPPLVVIAELLGLLTVQLALFRQEINRSTNPQV